MLNISTHLILSFFQPVKCHICGNILQCYELLKAHQSVPNNCGSCKQPFKTTCELLRHKCEGLPKDEPIQKKIKIKTEPIDTDSTSSQGAPVVLKTINDDNVPAIVDEEINKKSK